MSRDSELDQNLSGDLRKIFSSDLNFEGLVTLTLTLDPAIRHTVVHHSSTSTCIPNFIEIEETFCGRTDGRTDGYFSPL